MDTLVSEFNKIERKVGNISNLFRIGCEMLFPQIASDYAQQDYQDFAVVIQPFVSNTKADKFPIEYLSDVSVMVSVYYYALCRSLL